MEVVRFFYSLGLIISLGFIQSVSAENSEIFSAPSSKIYENEDFFYGGEADLTSREAQERYTNYLKSAFRDFLMDSFERRPSWGSFYEKALIEGKLRRKMGFVSQPLRFEFRGHINPPRNLMGSVLLTRMSELERFFFLTEIEHVSAESFRIVDVFKLINSQGRIIGVLSGIEGCSKKNFSSDINCNHDFLLVGLKNITSWNAFYGISMLQNIYDSVYKMSLRGIFGYSLLSLEELGEHFDVFKLFESEDYKLQGFFPKKNQYTIPKEGFLQKIFGTEMSHLRPLVLLRELNSSENALFSFGSSKGKFEKEVFVEFNKKNYKCEALWSINVGSFN